jgi:hypothetical protein
MQFENLYARYLLLTKKRYVCYTANRKGEIVDVIKKGVVIARRDNCDYLKSTYKAICMAILDNETEEKVLDILYTKVHELFTRQVPDANLIIYMGVGNVINYAKKKEEKNGRSIVKREFIGSDGKPIKPDPTDALDDRLVYQNIPQALLSLKMLRRGDDVPANTRLEYIYLENPKAVYLGDKAEDYTYYRENKRDMKFKPDYLHYVEKQLMKPISELLDVKFPKNIVIPYEKLDDAVLRHIKNLNELLRQRVLAVKTHTKTIKDRVYKYTKLYAQVQYILDSAEKKRQNPNIHHEVDWVRGSSAKAWARRPNQLRGWPPDRSTLMVVLD